VTGARWVRTLAALLLLAIAVGRAAPQAADSDFAGGSGRPNVVVIMFDDLDVALAEAMPGWDAIASRSVVFDRAYVTTPLCCPSRMSFLTGQWAHTHGVYSNGPPDGGYARAVELGLEDSILPVWLHRGGYRTSLVGRYLNGHGRFTTERIPPGWDDWQAVSRSEYRGYELNDNGTTIRPRRYATDELARRALRILRETPEPFFLWLAPTAPHTPVDVAKRHRDAAAPSTVDVDRYRLMLAGMDLLERVLDEVPDNTYVVITSDNGFHTTPIWGKDLPYDTDTRVPLLILGPDLQPARVERIVANVDLAPTIAEWAGVPAPAVEGTSLVPLLQGREVAWRDELMLERVGVWQATRTTDELVIEWADGRVERITD
jgi:N-acetylglucosamine-6-sulfatase